MNQITQEELNWIMQRRSQMQGRSRVDFPCNVPPTQSVHNAHVERTKQRTEVQSAPRVDQGGSRVDFPYNVPPTQSVHNAYVERTGQRTELQNTPGVDQGRSRVDFPCNVPPTQSVHNAHVERTRQRTELQNTPGTDQQKQRHIYQSYPCTVFATHHPPPPPPPPPVQQQRQAQTYPEGAAVSLTDYVAQFNPGYDTEIEEIFQSIQETANSMMASTSRPAQSSITVPAAPSTTNSIMDPAPFQVSSPIKMPAVPSVIETSRRKRRHAYDDDLDTLEKLLGVVVGTVQNLKRSRLSAGKN